MSMTPPDRRVITFYSFKGGVGRTMAVANIAYRLANKHGLKVIAVDWDLEAPGLHRFFGLSSEDAAKAHGVLDYFLLWRDAVKRQDPEPPNVTEWVLPITDEKHKPRFGSLSLLLAGRLDATYDSRLAAFHWQDFYENDAGAAAVETLREQLVGKADVVLIDSRTGLTDAGGICTIQLPDGVVLMTAPNQQSLEGTERVARSIAKSSAEARAGREQPRMWFVASRVPSVEETFLAERWFAANEPWFNTGIVEGLWLKEDHQEGIQSHQIPYRARWGFDELVLNEAAKVDPRDALAVPYDRLAETLLRWLRGEPPTVLGATKATSEQLADWRDVEALQNEVTDAERRGDILGMGISLQKLALGLYVSDRYDEAIRKADQASGIFLSRGSRINHLDSLVTLGRTLLNARRYGEAEQTITKALDLARELGRRSEEAEALYSLAELCVRQGLKKDALRHLTEAHRVLESIPDESGSAWAWLVVSGLFEESGEARKAAKILRIGVELSRLHADEEAEESALRRLLDISDAGERLPDAAALRARLDELRAKQRGTK